MKKIETKKNYQGGIDLILNTEGGLVRIQSGHNKKSLDFWKEMQRTAENAINTLTTPKIFVVAIGDNGYATKRTYIANPEKIATGKPFSRKSRIR